MPVSIDIVPFADSVAMYGPVDPLSAYSVAGHVTVSITSPTALFERQRAIRILLHSVKITFEGQSEIITPMTGYSPIRLCSVCRDIVPGEPVEMSNEGYEKSDLPCVWNVVFDLAVPGWLPPSSVHGSGNLGVRYTLFAEAKYSYYVDDFTHNWSILTLCSPFRSRLRTLDTHKRIELRRFICRSDKTSSGSQDAATYLVKRITCQSEGNSASFPPGILSQLQVTASVPEYVDIEQSDIPLVVRIGAGGLDEEQGKRIQIISLSVDIIQKENFSQQPYAEYLARYPVPPPSQQPPHTPLRDPDPLSSIYEVGLSSYNLAGDKISRSFSLLPPGQSCVQFIRSHNYPLADEEGDSSLLESNGHYTLESHVPFVRQAPDDDASDWAGSPFLRSSVESPLIEVTHKAVIGLACTYNIPGADDETAIENLVFSIPIYFARFAPTIYHRIIPLSILQAHDPSTCMNTRPCSPEPAPTLPAYSQLFDHSGEFKIDYSTPLPPYAPGSTKDHPVTAPVNIPPRRSEDDETTPFLPRLM